MNREVKTIYEFGDFRLDPTDRLLWRDKEIVPLSPKVFETLLLLVEGGGRVVSKEQLMDFLWADSFVEEGSLAQNISLLRRKLDKGRDKSCIETLPKRGYRFVAEVKAVPGKDFDLIIQSHVRTRIITSVEERELPEGEIEQIPQPVLEASEASKETLQLSPAITESRALLPVETKTLAIRGVSRKTSGVIFLAITLLTVALAYFALKYWNRQPTTIAEIKSIAVLPFQNIGAESNDQYLGVGLADALITKFGNLRRIEVRPTSAIRKYAETKTDPIKAGRELEVEAVMEGSVQRVENRIRVTVQLIRVGDGASVWSEKFDAEFTNLLAVEDSISSQVLHHLSKEISSEEQDRIKKPTTTNAEAHRLYLQGRYFWNQRTPKALKQALEFFEEAIRLDPAYALAHTGLADCYITMGDSGYSYMAPTEAYPKARAAAQKALELDEKLAEAHTAIGCVQMMYEWNLDGANKSFKRALELNPNYSTLFRWYGWYFIAKGQYAEAEQMMQRAHEQDPVSPIVLTEVGYPAFFAGDYDTAIKHFSKALEFDKNSVPALFGLWRVYKLKGEFDRSLAELERAEKITGENVQFTICRGITFAASGRIQEARKILDSLIARKRAGEFVPPLILAVFNAELGNKDEAFVLLKQAMTERNDIIYMRNAPEFQSLLSDSRVAELLRQSGLAL